jgi:hypothetical protein
MVGGVAAMAASDSGVWTPNAHALIIVFQAGLVDASTCTSLYLRSQTPTYISESVSICHLRSELRRLDTLTKLTKQELGEVCVAHAMTCP